MIEQIRKKLDTPELLCQLSEEASELAQAALKLRRAITGINPTPVSVEEATDDLEEEIADVMLCLSVAGFSNHPAKYKKAMDAKAQRWATRLERTSPLNKIPAVCADCGMWPSKSCRTCQYLTGADDGGDDQCPF